jgi:hypothetical protein
MAACERSSPEVILPSRSSRHPNTTSSCSRPPDRSAGSAAPAWIWRPRTSSRSSSWSGHGAKGARKPPGRHEAQDEVAPNRLGCEPTRTLGAGGLKRPSVRPDRQDGIAGSIGRTDEVSVSPERNELGPSLDQLHPRPISSRPRCPARWREDRAALRPPQARPAAAGPRSRRRAPGRRFRCRQRRSTRSSPSQAPGPPYSRD